MIFSLHTVACLLNPKLYVESLGRVPHVDEWEQRGSQLEFHKCSQMMRVRVQYLVVVSFICRT